MVDSFQRWCYEPGRRLGTRRLGQLEETHVSAHSSHQSAASPLSAKRSRPLKGRLRPPGDKSISHRAFLFGLLTCGETKVEGLLEGDDVLATGKACQALGAEIERLAPGQWRIRGPGLGALPPPRETLDFGNAGTGCRLMMGVVGGHGITATFDGDASLRKRPMRRILDPVRLMGAQVQSEAEGGRCPIVLKGARDPAPIEYRTPVASAQIKSAVLLAGLNAPGETTVIEDQASRDHTEKMLVHFGAQVVVAPEGEGRRITLVGRPELRPNAVVVPADPSSAAFPIVAALIVPGSDIVVEGMMMNPLRIGLLTTLKEMGAHIEALDTRVEGGEEVADLRVRAGTLKGVDVPAARAPSMIDEYPILSVIAACARGTTRMRGLGELRVKESDRLAAMATGLAACGATVSVEGDDLIVTGTGQPPRGGAEIAVHLDHRIGMSFLVLGMVAKEPVAVDDGSTIDTSFPGFAHLMNRLGAKIGPVES
jgi:3-phosphoshikimate 1-carboxyvinyltransferase